MPVLLLEAIRKRYGVKPLLDDVSFSLEDAGKMGVIGPNGSGKTTLLLLVACWFVDRDTNSSGTTFSTSHSTCSLLCATSP
jgi:ABC-type multidrug transport system ATPase subunit